MCLHTASSLVECNPHSAEGTQADQVPPDATSGMHMHTAATTQQYAYLAAVCICIPLVASVEDFGVESTITGKTPGQMGTCHLQMLCMGSAGVVLERHRVDREDV